MAEMAGLSAPTMDWASTYVPQAFKKCNTICQLMFDGPLAEKTEAVKVKYSYFCGPWRKALTFLALGT